MSYKIFNGYKLDKNLTFFELNEFRKKVKMLIKQKAVDLAEKRVAKLATTLIDFYTLFGKEKLKMHCGEIFKEELGFVIDTKNEPFFMAWDILNSYDLHLIRNKTYDSIYNVEIIFFPIEDKILALFFSNDPEYENIFEQIDIVSEYNYFNNTDKPKETSNEEWEIREKEWERVLPYASIVIESGFSTRLISSIPSILDINKENAKKHIPDIDSRIKEMLSCIMTSEYIDRGYKNKLDFADWKKTEEYKKLYEIKKEKIKEKLIKDIDLLRWE